MNELALFAGAGGGILGGKLLGWKCVCAVEYEPAARRMLMARQDDGCLEPFPVWDDVRTFDGKPWRGRVDVVSGGFPCQDISAAGRGAGIDGERSGLWSEMSRIIGEVRPRFVLVENSPVLTSRGLGTVLGDLAALGYNARWGVLGAVHAGAPHKRERIWIVAHSSRIQPGRPEQRPERERTGTRRESGAVAHASAGRHGTEIDEICSGRNAAINGRSTLADSNCLRQLQPEGSEQAERRWTGDGGEPLADTNGVGCGTRRDGRQREAGERPNDESTGPAQSSESLPGAAPRGAGQWWLTEPDVGRVAHGVASRVDRLRALGNGQVPAVVPLAWSILRPNDSPE